MTEQIREKLMLLPECPGCYLMKQRDKIIYVGKAINLKNRVRSYFHTRDHTPKVAAMIEKVDDFELILCDSELEALLLECNLIKLHQPYYNILLRDDKHYPYIRIDVKEPFPRVEIARKIQKDGARYLGPYIAANAVHDVIAVLRRTFPLRTCSTPPDPDKPRRPCVHYEIGQCLAPCAGFVTAEAYHQVIVEVIQFLTGKSTSVLKKMREEMQAAAADLQFERAASLRDRIYSAERLLEQQKTIMVSGVERDVVAVAQDGLDAMAEVLHVRSGKMIGGDSFTLEKAGDEEKSDIIANFIMQYYEDAPIIPKEVLAQALPENYQMIADALSQRRGSRVELLSPQRGEKRALVLMAEKNAKDALEKRNARAQKSWERTEGAAKALAEAIGITGTPRRIEGFDISNTQGILSVASMVVFIDGAPAYKEYRHYRIKTVEGANDCASMEEVLGRRFRRGIAEKEKRSAEGLPPKESGFEDLPDLVLIDGGPEQLAFARRAMQKAGGNVPMFGLAERLEEIWLPDADSPILLERHSPALHLIQRIRDEAHRFAITHHRSLRAKQTIHSKLEDIPGVGSKRRAALLKKFRSMEALRNASIEEMALVPGMTLPAAKAVAKWFETEALKKRNDLQ